MFNFTIIVDASPTSFIPDEFKALQDIILVLACLTTIFVFAQSCIAGVRDAMDDIALAAAVKTAEMVKDATDSDSHEFAVELPGSMPEDIGGFEEAGKTEMERDQKSLTDPATTTTSTVGDSEPMETSDDYVDDFDMSEEEPWDEETEEELYDWEREPDIVENEEGVEP
ncbi:hypothetical protein K440DRAFT_638303 [Wilcoxina mikolae CBS 423.85]|nr:hypothetical protein K440DRAFT_638303 [Wilcoxina mikolae CBS 423.85]